MHCRGVCLSPAGGRPLRAHGLRACTRRRTRRSWYNQLQSCHSELSDFFRPCPTGGRQRRASASKLHPPPDHFLGVLCFVALFQLMIFLEFCADGPQADDRGGHTAFKLHPLPDRLLPLLLPQHLLTFWSSWGCKCPAGRRQRRAHGVQAAPAPGSTGAAAAVRALWRAFPGQPGHERGRAQPQLRAAPSLGRLAHHR